MYVLFILCVMPRLLSSNNQTFERRRYVNTELDFPWHVGYTLYTTTRRGAYYRANIYRSIRKIGRFEGKRVFELPIELLARTGRHRDVISLKLKRFASISNSDFILNVNHTRGRKREISFVTLLSYFPRLP